jgi:hypothetical protein
MADNSVVISVEVDASGVAKAVEVVQQEVGKTEEKAKSLKAQMKALRDELGKVPEGSKDWQRLTGEIGKLKDKMDAMGESVKTVTGEPLERLNSSFSMVGSSISSLDFGAAVTGLQGTANAIKQVKFGDLSSATKDFSKTMLDLGKALLFNPLFVIGSVIVGIITNFEELTKMGGFIGNFFGSIKNVIDGVWNSMVGFLDSLGVIDSKAQEREENQKKLDKEAEQRRKKQEEQSLKDAEHLHKEKERLAKEAAEKEEKRIQKIKDDQKSLTDFLKAEQEKRYQDTLADDDKAIRQLRLLYAEKLKLANGNTSLIADLDAWYQAEQKRINDETDVDIQSKDIKRVESKTATNDQILASTQAMLTSLGVAETNSANASVETERLSSEQKIQMAFSVANSLMSIMDSLGKQDKAGAKRRFNINKALGIAQAGINTYMAVNAALTAGGNPIKLATGAQFVEAGIALTMGLANVAKISATKFNDGGGNTPPPAGGGGNGGGMGGGGGSTSAPALDLSFLNNAQTKAQPIQSYVLATNVTSAQDAQQKIIDQAKLIK